MRIIAGERRGTRLAALPGLEARPTLDRVKEGMFSAVQFLVPGARVLDLFAGSGQLGLEALSRGAASCIFVDESREACAVIRANAEAARYTGQCKVRHSGVAEFLAHSGERFDLILADPPFAKGIFPGLLSQIAAVCAPGAALLCESEAEAAPLFSKVLAGLALQKQYRYGTVLVSRYRAEEATTA